MELIVSVKSSWADCRVRWFKSFTWLMETVLLLVKTRCILNKKMAASDSTCV